MDNIIRWYINNRHENVPVKNFQIRERDRKDYQFVREHFALSDLCDYTIDKTIAYYKLGKADAPGSWTIYADNQNYVLIYEGFGEKIYSIKFYFDGNDWICQKKKYAYLLDLIEDILNKKSLYYVNLC